MATYSCTIAHLTESKDYKWFIGIRKSYLDLSANNMIGNSKNTDSARRESTEPTKREGSKIFSDSSKILPAMPIGDLSRTSLQCLRQWSPALF